MHFLAIDTSYSRRLDPRKGASLELMLIANEMGRLSCLFHVLLVTRVCQHGPHWTLSAIQVAAGECLGDFIRGGGCLRSF